MIQAAVDAEPDNAAFRDSLGWVLFRQGQYRGGRGRTGKSRRRQNPRRRRPRSSRRRLSESRPARPGGRSWRKAAEAAAERKRRKGQGGGKENARQMTKTKTKAEGMPKSTKLRIIEGLRTSDFELRMRHLRHSSFLLRHSPRYQSFTTAKGAICQVIHIGRVLNTRRRWSTPSAASSGASWPRRSSWPPRPAAAIPTPTSASATPSTTPRP